MKKITTCFMTALLLMLTFAGTVHAAEIQKIATWNMKWLGSSYDVDAIEDVDDYAGVIQSTDATVFALQEIDVTHSYKGYSRNYYLDLIVRHLNINGQEGEVWAYYLDKRNRNQRLAFLYREDLWKLADAKNVWPGSSYRSARRPLVGKFISKTSQFDFTLINVHFKAFPDDKSRKKRSKNIVELNNWLRKFPINDEVIIAGDTNIYSSDGDIESPFRKNGFTPIADDELSSVHKGVMSQRFDRFYASQEMAEEINGAILIVGQQQLVDVVKRDDPAYIRAFDKNISDHFPVVLNIAF